MRAHAGWCSDHDLREALNLSSPRRDYRWRELELTLDDDCDAFAVFDYPSLELDPSRTVVFQTRPKAERRAAMAHYRHLLEGALVFDVERHFRLAPWTVDVPVRGEKSGELSALLGVDDDEDPLVEVVQRLGAAVDAHRVVRRTTVDTGARRRRTEALEPFRYVLTAEETVEANFFTGALLDPILAGCLCFYDGCPNLEAFVDPACVIRVDTRDPGGAAALVREALAAGEWERRQDAIEEQRQRLVAELHPLELVRRVLTGEPIAWRAEPGTRGRVDTPAGGASAAQVINLRSARERRERISAHLDRLGVRYDIVPAVVGSELRHDEVAALHDRAASYHRTRRALGPGEIGAAISHHRALERIGALDVPIGIVFEDDARLTDDAAAVLASLAGLARDGDIVLLGSFGATPLRASPLAHLACGRELRAISRSGVWGAFAYAVTPATARLLARELVPVRSVADDWALFGRAFRLSAVEPPCAWATGPYMETSTIEGDRLALRGHTLAPARFSLLERAAYAARLREVDRPLLGGLAVRVLDLVELAGQRVTPLRRRR